MAKKVMIVVGTRPNFIKITQFEKEFKAFGRNVWVKLIQSLGLKVTKVIGLPFYVGHGNRFIPIIKAGNALKLSATYLYVIKK